MLYTKVCPRCSGDVKLDRDNYGVYAKCLQCGFNRDFVTRRDKPAASGGTGSLFGPVSVPGLDSIGMPTEEPSDPAQREAA
jgi:hypothetical protein